MDAIQITAGVVRNVERLLARRGWPQAELARRAGIATPHVSRFLSAGRAVSLDTVSRVAAALEVSPEELLGPPLIPLFADPAQCGRPVEWADATPVPAEWLNLSTFFGPADELFLVVARGDSMTGAGVEDGDYLVIRRRSVGEIGQRVLALVGGAAALKELRKEGRKLVLRSCAAGHADLPVGPDTTVIGLLVGVIRKEKP